MALSIKQFGDKLRLEVTGETWQFDTREELEAALKSILDLKEKHGQLFQQQPHQHPPLQGTTVRPLKHSREWGVGGDVEGEDGQQ